MAPTLINLLTQYTPVQDSVLRQLEIKDVLALTKTTKLFGDFMKTVEKTQFKINDALKEFFDPIALRQIQASHNVLITGSFAYAFMARQRVVDSSDQPKLDYVIAEQGTPFQALKGIL
jgi:hypothetical protein